MVFNALLTKRPIFPAVTKFLALVAITCATTSPAFSAIITLAADRDTTFVQQSGFNTKNFGATTSFAVGNLTGNQRSILSFAMAPLTTALGGQDFTVQSVTLRLTAVAVPTFANSATLTPEVHAITAANQNWVEGAGDNGGNGAVIAGTSSWDQKQQTVANWAGNAGGLSVAGTDYQTAALATQSLTSSDGISAGTQIDFVFGGVLYPLINGWLTSNPGLLLFDPQFDPNQTPPSGTTRVVFASREHATSAWQPQLIIEYTPVPEPTSWGLLSAGLLGLIVWRRRSLSC